MKNISARFDSVKSYVPSLLSSSKEKVSEIFTVMTQSESDFLAKKENTDADIRELLYSKMEVEVVLGLKFLMVHILKGKDISSFQADVVNLYLNNSFMIKKLCLNIIDYIALGKSEVLMMLCNTISKRISDTDPLQRWTALHLISALKIQPNAQDVTKHLSHLFSDSNPVIRRLALLTLVQFIKYTSKEHLMLISEGEYISTLQKYFRDPHPLIFSTAFYAICELANKDYLSVNIPQYFVHYCENLNKVDDFYYERVVFSLVNFSKLFLFNNFDKNHKYINLLFKSLYENVKYTTNLSKALSAMNGIYEILYAIDQLQLNSISRDELQLFKNGRQIEKLGKFLIRLILSSRWEQDKFLALELTTKFINTARTTSTNDSFLEKVKPQLEKNFNIFFLKIGEKEYISVKKLEILITLANVNNIKTILEEFRRSLNYPNMALKRMIIKSIYHICKKNSETNINRPSSSLQTDITFLCIEKLIEMLKLKEEAVISQIIVCLRKLILEIKEQTKFVLIYNIKNYKKNITSSIAKANIIWMISQYIHVIPTVSVDFFRRLLIDIDNESDEVKSQILGFALRINAELSLIANQYNSDVREANTSRMVNLIQYAIEKLFWDKNYNIREKARMVGFLVKNKIFDRELDFLAKYEADMDLNKKESINEVDKNVFGLSIASKSDLNRKFEFDSIDNSIDPNFFKITLDDIINMKKGEEAEKNEPKAVNSSEKYSSVKKQGHVNESIQNFDSGINVEEMKMKMKNQLDSWLNADDDEEDEYDVEIQHD